MNIDNNSRCTELLGYRYRKPWPPVGTKEVGQWIADYILR